MSRPPKHWSLNRDHVPLWKQRAAAATLGQRVLPWESLQEWSSRTLQGHTRLRPLPDSHLLFIGVYVLGSEPQPQRSYVGFTTEPQRRLKQHNGELKNGAKRTSTGRPWRMTLFVSGFPSKVEALRFEYALTYPEHSIWARPLLHHPVMLRVPLGQRSPHGKARLAQLLQRVGEFATMPLKTTWLSSESQNLNEVEFV
jgi:predicted GIY-YIG superfamily endonuclease